MYRSCTTHRSSRGNVYNHIDRTRSEFRVHTKPGAHTRTITLSHAAEHYCGNVYRSSRSCISAPWNLAQIIHIRENDIGDPYSSACTGLICPMCTRCKIAGNRCGDLVIAGYCTVRRTHVKTQHPRPNFSADFLDKSRRKTDAEGRCCTVVQRPRDRCVYTGRPRRDFSKASVFGVRAALP